MKIDRIYLNEDLKSQQDVFSFVALEMEKNHVVDYGTDFLEALNEREEQGTTGLIQGFAIPHAKSEKIKTTAIIYIRNIHGIEWNSLDGQLITDIFAFAIPMHDETNHLDDLIELSMQLMDENKRQKLRMLDSLDDMNQLFDHINS